MGGRLRFNFMGLSVLYTVRSFELYSQTVR